MIYVTSLRLADVDYCHSNPCKNNGTCHSDLDDYICNCFAGFTGKSCAGLTLFFHKRYGPGDYVSTVFNICWKENTKRRGGSDFFGFLYVKYNADF